MDVSSSFTYSFGDFRLDTEKRLLFGHGGDIIALMPKAYDTLHYLIENSGKTVEKNEIMSAVWPDTVVEENNLSQNISILRKALGEKRGDNRYIVTIPGRGFQFVAEVRANGVSNTREVPTTSADAILSDEILVRSQADAETENNAVKSADANIGRKGRVWLWALTLMTLISTAIGFAFYLKSDSHPAPSGIKTLAVLPFKPMIAGDRDEAMEVGMADTLILRLSNNRDIVVRQLSSVRQYTDLDQDALQAGRSLGVDAVLDGSIQRSGDQVRVNVKLIKVVDGSTFWLETFDYKFTDIFKLQDAISSRVTSALDLRVQGETRAVQEYTASSKAYELYWSGRLYQFRVTPVNLKKAIDYYKRAVESDPNFVLAYVGMTETYKSLAFATYAPSKAAVTQAKASALRAVELNDRIAETHVALGWALWMDWDWKAAEEHLKTAVSLAPNSSQAHVAYAHFLSQTGRHDEAITEGILARKLDPTTSLTMTMEGQFLFFAGKNDEAIARLNKTLEIDPNFWVAYNAIARAYIREGNYDEAITVLTKAKELSNGSSEPVFQLGYALAKSGQRQKALSVLNEMKKSSEQNFVPSYGFAMVYNGLGEKEKALKYLEKSFEDREVSLTFANIDTRWDNLRAEPRFIAIIRRMGLE